MSEINPPERPKPVEVMIEHGRFLPEILAESWSLHNPEWTFSDGISRLIKSDIDMYVFVDRMRLMIDNLILRLEGSDERLAEHHDALGVAHDPCPICTALRERNNRRAELLYGQVSIYASLALAVAEYRFQFDTWPTEARGSELSLPEGAWDEELAATVQEKIDLSADGGAEIIVAGFEGACGHASGGVAIGSNEYSEAARWLYGGLWSHGVEGSWLMASEQEEELFELAANVEQDAYDKAEHPRYWHVPLHEIWQGGYFGLLT
ncbi:hypothetical protein Gocc_3096 [Gaiella occulta]|uniref:Uncharacterized protein n=1 Tax=Gaiella occulta TaxID=1002870 RepID=A0A7M2YSN6_9ACTN|nr:hypothetical protein [Gaiella occulta]RDI73182.1 hypothetical protein Gocc_3096 [Gaiella occulta]